MYIYEDEYNYISRGSLQPLLFNLKLGTPRNSIVPMLLNLTRKSYYYMKNNIQYLHIG